jgi:uncharacterized protein YbjQ (UPF0145 family)
VSRGSELQPAGDSRAEMRQAVAALSTRPSGGRGVTSDLSIDETLLLHSIGWEPVDLVFGVSWWSIPWGAWQWQTGEITDASSAFAGAFADAAQQLREECGEAGGSGVVGVEIKFRVAAHHVNLELTGTAVRRVDHHRAGFEFISDLSARDFALLTRAGWLPLGLVAGASFVVAPRRTARQWAAQQAQNTELPHLTEALYLAREGAMSRMQQAGVDVGADGVIGVRLREGPLGHSARVMQFVAVGTAVHLAADSHRRINPTMAVTLDDAVLQFDVASLRSGR